MLSALEVRGSGSGDQARRHEMNKHRLRAVSTAAIPLAALTVPTLAEMLNAATAYTDIY
jgi:hypothetical protein